MKKRVEMIDELKKIGITKSLGEELRTWISDKANKFLATKNLKDLMFVEEFWETGESFRKDIEEVLAGKKENREIFRGKLKSIRKALLDGFEIAEVMGKEINFEVFPPGSPLPKSENEEEFKKTEKPDHPDRFPRKYWTMQALREWGTKFTLRNSKERKDKTESYSLFFVPEYNCVIAVADEYGKATYFLPHKNWQKFAKSRKIDDLRPDERVQWQAMPRNIGKEEWTEVIGEYLLQMQDIGEQEKTKDENIAGNKVKEKSSKVKKNFESKEDEISYYRKLLQAEIPRLKEEANLCEHKVKYIFSFLKGNNKWGKVGSFGNISTFPNAQFLRDAEIISGTDDRMTNPSQLKKLFEFLGLPVASEEEEKAYYGELLQAEIPRLKEEANLCEHKGKYIFSFLKGFNKWGKVGSFGNMKNFPNAQFLRDAEIISGTDKSMTNLSQLKQLFEFLGLPVANEEEEKAYYGELLQAEIPRLKEEANLCEHKGKYIFSFLKGNNKWGKVGSFGNMMSFPNRQFLRDAEIISGTDDKMRTASQLKKIFEFLGLPVANEEEEKAYSESLK